MNERQADIFGGYKEIKNKIKKSVPKKQTKLQQKIKLLYTLYAELYKRQNINVLEQRDIIIKNGLAVYPQDKQAEPIEIINLTLQDIDEKLKIMQEKIQNDKFGI